MAKKRQPRDYQSPYKLLGLAAQAAVMGKPGRSKNQAWRGGARKMHYGVR